MDSWLIFWTVLLIAALVVFAGLVVVVTVGGFFDIKKLFRSIEARHADKKQDVEADGP